MPSFEQIATSTTTVANTADVTGAVADDGGVQTDETTEATNDTANDMTLLPAAPAVNDAYYFAGDKAFNNLRLTIGTSGEGNWTITWEYWDGAAWSSLAGVTDDTSGFTAAAGTHDVTFTHPTDWKLTNVAGIVNKYWIRARVSAFVAVVTQPLGTQAWTLNTWVNTTNAYTFNNSYASSTTHNAEQQYDYPNFSPSNLGGNEVLDKVFVKLKWYYKLTGVTAGDDANITFTVKVYDGSSWTSYTVGYAVFACTTANDESFTDTAGSNNIQTVFIDVTGKLGTMAKLNLAATRLLTTLTADAGLTPQIYVDAISVLACYHRPYGVMATRGAAQTKRELPNEYQTLEQLAHSLRS